MRGLGDQPCAARRHWRRPCDILVMADTRSLSAAHRPGSPSTQATISPAMDPSSRSPRDRVVIAVESPRVTAPGLPAGRGMLRSRRHPHRRPPGAVTPARTRPLGAVLGRLVRDPLLALGRVHRGRSAVVLASFAGPAPAGLERSSPTDRLGDGDQWRERSPSPQRRPARRPRASSGERQDDGSARRPSSPDAIALACRGGCSLSREGSEHAVVGSAGDRAALSSVPRDLAPGHRPGILANRVRAGLANSGQRAERYST